MSDRGPNDARRFAGKVAAHQKWVVNQDEEFQNDLAEGLARNFNRYGYYLCPCREGAGSRQLDRDIICPCRYAGADLEEHGHCFCGLFLTNEFARSGRSPESIPERRTTPEDSP